MSIAEYTIVVFMALGLLFSFGTTVGLIRLPDFYTRCHAASKGDTLSSLFMLSAMIIYVLQDWSLANLIVSIKIAFIIIFLFVASPTAAHVLLRAAYRSGAEPWTKPDDDEEEG